MVDQETRGAAMSGIIDPQLAKPIADFARRRRMLVIVRGLCSTLVVALGCFALLAIADYGWLLDERTRLFGSVGCYAVILVTFGLTVIFPGAVGESPVAVAARMETSVPELKDHLLAAVELSQESDQAQHDSAQFRYLLRRRVISVLEVIPIASLLPWRLIRTSLIWAAGLACLLVIGVLFPGSPWGQLFARAILPTANIARVSTTKIAILQPELDQRWVPAGETLEILASISSPRANLSPLVQLQVGNREVAELELLPAAGFEGLRYRVNVGIGSEPLRFRVVAGDGITAWRAMEPKPRPAIDAFEIEYQLPDYTGLPPRKVKASTGDLRAISGATVNLKAQVNQPLAKIDLELQMRPAGSQQETDERKQPSFTRSGPAAYQTSLLMKDSGSYQISMTALETLFDNPFSPRYQIQVLPDVAPKVQLRRVGTPAALCSARDLLSWATFIEDEFAVASVRFEYAINGEPYQASDTELAIEVDAEMSEPQSYRVISRSAWQWDLQQLSLKPGDLLQARLTVRDLKGQSTTTEPVVLRIANDRFAADRHLYLRGRSQLVALLDAWAAGATADSETTLAENLPAAIESTMRWLLERKPASGDLVELEWGWQLFHELNREPEDESVLEQRNQLVAAARTFNAYTAIDAFAADLLGLDAELQRVLAVGGRQPAAWLRRQGELCVEYFRDNAQQIGMVLDAVPEPTARELRGLSQRYRDLADRLEDQIEQADQPTRWMAEIKNLHNELLGRSGNLILEGGVPHRANDALRKLHGMLPPKAIVLRNLVDATLQVSQLSKQRGELTDARALTALNEDLEKWERTQEEVFNNFLQRVDQHLEVHRLRPDFSAELLADLTLCKQAISALVSLPEVKFQTLRGVAAADTGGQIIARHEHLKRAANACEILLAGQQVRAAEAVWRPLLIDERWSESPRLRRLENPRRWDYFVVLIDEAARKLRTTQIDSTIAGRIDRVRYDSPADIVGPNLSNRRWDGKTTSSVADDLATIHDRWLAATGELTEPMELARQVLREYLPESFGESGAEPLEVAANDGSENVAAEQATEQAAAEMPENSETLLQELAAALSAGQESAQSLLERLEREIPKSPPLQAELSAVSQQIVEQAVSGLAEAERREYDLRRQLEQNDPEVKQAKRLLAERINDLGRQAEDVRQNLIDQARGAAARGAVPEAAEQLGQVAERMSKLANTAGQANENKLMTELAELAEDTSSQLAAAQQQLQKAEAATAARQANAIEDNQGNRARTREQMQTTMQRAQTQRVRNAEQRERQWNNLARVLEKDRQRAEQQVDRQRKDLKRAENQLTQRPDDSGRQRAVRDAERNLAQQQQLAEILQRQVEAIKTEVAAAKAMVAERKGAAKPKLTADNPAAESAAQLAATASDELTQLAQLADQIRADSGVQNEVPSALAVSPQTARDAANRQRALANQVEQIAESLARAARHEGRLGGTAMARQLAGAAERVQALANQPLAAAGQMAERAQAAGAELEADPANITPAAVDGLPTAVSLANAQQKIAAELGRVNALAEAGRNQSSSDGNQSSAEGNQSASDGNQSRSAATAAAGSNAAGERSSESWAELGPPAAQAQLIDDLDRLLNQNPEANVLQQSPLLAEAAAASQRQQAAQSAQARGPATAAGQPGDQLAGSQLAEAMIAAEVMAAGEPSATGSGEFGEPSESVLGRLDTNRRAAVAAGSREDWAELRERRPDDVAEETKSDLPPRYRRQIEAYFRALAERAQ